MININELALNLCGLPSFIYSESDVEAYIKYLSRISATHCNNAPSRVYIGSEFCENMPLNYENMERVYTVCKNLGYSITLCLPPLRQSQFEKVTNEVQRLVCRITTIDEISVNDCGTLLHLQNQNYKGVSIVAGRLFDKTIREARINPFQITEIEKNIEMIESFYLSDVLHSPFFKSASVSRLETDTLPGGVLRLSQDLKFDYSIFYPRIYLSRSNYCEFASFEDIASEKFRLRSQCKFTCAEYIEQINEHTFLPIYKSLNCVFARQSKNIEECVVGNFRLVFTELLPYDKCYEK
jgi:hypothetical protein